MKVLILSSIDDPHAAAVASHLATMNVQVDYLGLDQFAQPCRLVYSLGRKERLCSIKRTNESLDFWSYSSVWNRRPGKVATLAFPEPWMGEMAALESRDTFYGIFSSMQCLWVNNPHSDMACLQKLFQLELAARSGFSIPETVVTNDPEYVKRFFKECNGQVIYKLISEATNHFVPTYEIVGIPTLPLREEDLEFIDQVRYTPHLFQRYIDKAFDVRVTIVGKKIFAGRIHSQTGVGKIDWRHDYSVKMEPIELPIEIANACLELMRRLRLNYGAIDLCECASGDYVFLEINCAGQFLWLEQRANLPIALELAKLLARESEPLIEPEQEI